MLDNLKEAILKFITPQQTATENYIYTTDQSINIFNVKSICFINKDAAKVYINSLPLELNDSLTYNADSRSQLTDNFNIVFEGGAGKLYISIIR